MLALDRSVAVSGSNVPCYSPLKGFVNKENGGIVFKRSGIAGPEMEVACGQCLGCRLDRSKMWASRIVHEASLHEQNCFITLTYDDDHMPDKGSLIKPDFQKFMKRLRKRFKNRRIRYYQCGEYGDELERPHYHACLFNLEFPDKELFSQNQGNFLFTSEILGKLWPYGFSTIGDLTYESAAYCARYVLKKVSGKMQDDHYLRYDPETGEAYWLEPEYTTMSRRPGIGKEWYDKFKKDLHDDRCPVPGQGVYNKIPRYYGELLRKDSEDVAEAIKSKRQQYYQENKDEFSPERLMAKYKVKKAQVAMLKRSLK